MATRSRGCYFQLIASRSKDENCLLECRQCRLMLQKGGRQLSCLFSPVMVFCLYGWHWQLLSLEGGCVCRCTAEFIIIISGGHGPGSRSRGICPVRCCAVALEECCSRARIRIAPSRRTVSGRVRVRVDGCVTAPCLALRGRASLSLAGWLPAFRSASARPQPVDVTSRVFYLRI